MRSKKKIGVHGERVRPRLMGAVVAVVAAAGVVGGTATGAGAAPAQEPPPTPKIIGGVEADQPYPFMVSFQTERNGDPNSHRCSGTLIAKNWLVTAAHCVTEEGEGDEPYKFKDFTPYHLQIGSNDRTKGTIAKIKRAVVAPGYQANWDKEPWLGRDIALVQLDRNVPHKPVRLATRLTRPGTPAREVGWGYTSVGDVGDPTKLPVMLRQLDTKVISPKTPTCVSWEGDETGAIRDGDLCVENPDGWRGTCNGDSGAPLLTKVAGQWRAEGIDSRVTGPHCGASPDIYTSIGAYRSWIRKVTGV